MKSRTSYCKLTTFKKDLTRFAPVWALYLIGMMLVFTELGGYATYDHFAYNSMRDMVSAFGIVNLCYAGVCALVLFADLYNTRMCYSLHTQPARRESLFLSHLAAALCFSVVPNLVGALYLMVELEAYRVMALYWLLASTLQFVFYFGLAAVSAMCAGNRVGMIAVYAVLNFFSMIAYWVVDTVYLPNMYGVLLNFEDFNLLCPTVKLFSFDFFQFEGVEIYEQIHQTVRVFYQYRGLGDGWGYLAILGGIGVAMTALAVVLYRRRHLESAGDFVAFAKLSPVVNVVLTVCVGVGMAFLGDAMGSGYMLWLIVGLIVGFFGSRMLIERRVKVFHKRAFLGFAALAAVVTVSFLAVAYDWFGIVSFVPDPEKVESVTISNYKNNNNVILEEYYYGNRITTTLYEPEEIADILTAHQDILDRKNSNSNSRHRVTISYKLKSGRTVVRSYAAPASGTNYKILNKYLYSPENILGYTDWNDYVKRVNVISTKGFDIPEGYIEEFLLALRTDCENGTVGQNKAQDIVTWVYVNGKSADGRNFYRELAISSAAENTLALLKKPEIVLGFEDIKKVRLNYLIINGERISGEWSELLEALQKDVANGDVELGHGDGYYQIEYFVGQEKGECYRVLTVYKNAKNTIQWIEDNMD